MVSRDVWILSLIRRDLPSETDTKGTARDTFFPAPFALSQEKGRVLKGPA